MQWLVEAGQRLHLETERVWGVTTHSDSKTLLFSIPKYPSPMLGGPSFSLISHTPESMWMSKLFGVKAMMILGCVSIALVVLPLVLPPLPPPPMILMLLPLLLMLLLLMLAFSPSRSPSLSHPPIWYLILSLLSPHPTMHPLDNPNSLFPFFPFL